MICPDWHGCDHQLCRVIWWPYRKLYALDFRYFLPIRIFIREYVAIAPAVWRHTQDLDWCDLLAMWAWHLDRMAAYTEKYGHHVGSDKDARDQRRVAWVLREAAAGRWDAVTYFKNGRSHQLLSDKKVRETAWLQERRAVEWALRVVAKRFTWWWE